MDEEDITRVLLVALLILLLKKRHSLIQMDLGSSGQRQRGPSRPKRWGVRPILMARKKYGFYENLLQEARLSDPYVFYNFTRMSASSFDRLLGIVGPHIKKRSNREPISPGCRLAITLRFLATGDSYPSLSYGFRVGVSTICEIIRETCCVLWDKLQPIVLPILTEDELKGISKDFLSLWSLANCLGAIDGKHVVMQAPPNTGSLYYNYKKSFSIILLAVCDARYNFTYVDIGSYGSQSDGGVLSNSSFGKKLFANELNIPPPKELPYCPSKIKIPHFFVGDEAFPLRENLMRPFSKPRTGLLPRDERVFNYRLSRARRLIENSFGIMAARFRIFHRVINGNVETVDNIVKAAVCLHNFIRKENSEFYITDGDLDREVEGIVTPGRWRNEIPNEGTALQNVSIRLGARNAAFPALAIRNHIKNYVNGAGACFAPWQWDTIDRTN